MTVLTPFPTRTATNQTLTNDNVAVLRTEINRIVNNAFENTMTGPDQSAVTSQSFRSIILTLQAEINRIISLMVQSIPASVPAPVSGPVAQTTAFAAPAFGAYAAPLPYGSAAVPGFGVVPPTGFAGYSAYGPVAVTPAQSFGVQPFPVQPFPVQPFTGQPTYGQPAYGQSVFAQPVVSQPAVAQPAAFQPTFNPAAFGAMLLTEINRVFTSLLQDLSAPSAFGGNVYGGFAGASLFGTNPLTQNTVGFLQNEINRAFNAVLQQDQAGFGDTNSAFTPRINLFETTDTIEIEAELPGFDDSDIDLSANGNVVTIKGWRRRTANEGVREFHILERGYGTFSRSLTLPFEVDPKLIRASFNEGVLTVEITKPENARENTHRIDIARAS